MDEVVLLVDATGAAFEHTAELLALPAESIGRVRVGFRVVRHATGLAKLKLRGNMILNRIRNTVIVTDGVVVPQVQLIEWIGQMRVGRSPFLGR